jgi:hypothetical protein
VPINCKVSVHAFFSGKRGKRGLATTNRETKAEEPEDHGDHEGVATVLVGVQNEKTPRVADETCNEKDEKHGEAGCNGPELAAADGYKDEREAH